jgi:hypothetical protein
VSAFKNLLLNGTDNESAIHELATVVGDATAKTYAEVIGTSSAIPDDVKAACLESLRIPVSVDNGVVSVAAHVVGDTVGAAASWAVDIFTAAHSAVADILQPAANVVREFAETTGLPLNSFSLTSIIPMVVSTLLLHVLSRPRPVTPGTPSTRWHPVQRALSGTVTLGHMTAGVMVTHGVGSVTMDWVMKYIVQYFSGVAPVSVTAGLFAPNAFQLLRSAFQIPFVNRFATVAGTIIMMPRLRAIISKVAMWIGMGTTGGIILLATQFPEAAGSFLAFITAFMASQLIKWTAKGAVKLGEVALQATSAVLTIAARNVGKISVAAGRWTGRLTGMYRLV